MATDDELERLAASASRDDYGSIIRLARGLYESGLGKREVVGRCFGAEFPDEFFVIAGDDVFFEGEEIDGVSWAPPFSFANLPWETAISLEERQWPEPDAYTRLEIRAREIDRGLVPLLEFSNIYATHGGYVVCYHLDELQAGRPTVYRFHRSSPQGAQPIRVGDSLLAVMHEHCVDAVRRAEEEMRHPSNIGAGSISWDEVEWRQRWLARIAGLMRGA